MTSGASRSMQRFRITITRQADGSWHVLQQWEVPKWPHSLRPLIWERHGDPITCVTRKEALEHMLRLQGIPE